MITNLTNSNSNNNNNSVAAGDQLTTMKLAP